MQNLTSKQYTTSEQLGKNIYPDGNWKSINENIEKAFLFS